MSRALALVDSSRKDEAPNGATSLLATKLYLPRSGSALVPRHRLIDAIRDGEERRLTVVIAPAGFGKTTLLAGWLADVAARETAIGWVSLDPTDSEPALFWAYIVRALQNVNPAIGAEAAAQLRSPQPPPIEVVLTTLINEINASDSPFTLVLDDYHVIESAAVHNGLAFLLDHLPPRMRVVIASRSEPPLPLPRLRARGELTELRATDLRFTVDEASVFLNQVMGLDLSAKDAAMLERRTEGWIAGLKLAALSMKTRGDVRGFVDAFSGGNRYVADYLVEEVLQTESEPVRRFLLGTSILDRLSGPLCDAVTGETGSQAILEQLERRNLFVIALDDRREWYRYHHLFADVLQKLNSTAESVPEFQRRASVWYERHGSTSDAVRHALAANDVERAADMLEKNWPEKNRSYESGKWLARVKTLPEAVVRSRPLLNMGYAWGLLNSGELEAVEPRLNDVERWLQTNIVPGEEGSAARASSLATELAAARVYLAQAFGNTPGTLEHAQNALALTPEGDHAARATGLALVALAHWGRGELETAHSRFSEALAAMRTAGHDLDVIRGVFVLGDLRAAQGRLRQAATIYEEGLELARDARYSAAAETDELHLGLSEVHYEWNDLASAAMHLETLARAAKSSGHSGNRWRLGTALARICQANGQLERALEQLDEAEKHERRDPVPRVRPIPALKARVRLAQGKLDEAMAWVRESRISSRNDLGYLREFEHVTYARVLIARNGTRGGERSADEALRLLERLKSEAVTGGRIGSVIELLVLHALAQKALGNSRGALDSLNEALALAEPEGYLRVFLDEGNNMREILRHAVTRGLAGEYTRRVLSAFDAPRQQVAPPAAGPADDVQALTIREQEILRLIAAGLRNQEIAEHLDITAATVKRHIANTYTKLGVGHRTEALARAKELKLL